MSASSQASRAVCQHAGHGQLRRQGRGGHRRRQRDRARPRARVRRGRRAASSRPTSSRTRSSRPRPASERDHDAATDVTRFDDVARARRPRVRDVRPGRRALQQRRRVRGRADLGAAAERLRVDARRQPVGHPARDPRVRARACSPRNDPAHIVNTVSMAGLCATPFTAPYNVSKFAALAASECLAHDLAAVGAPIGVSVVVPERGRDPHRQVRPQPARRARRDDERRRGVRRAGARRPHGRPRSPAGGSRDDDPRRDPHEHVSRPDEGELRAAARGALRRARSNAGCRPCRTSTDRCSGTEHARARTRRRAARISPFASARSSDVTSMRVPLMPSQRSGSGSHCGDSWPTHGRCVMSVSRPRTRSASVRPARFVVETPSPT